MKSKALKIVAACLSLVMLGLMFSGCELLIDNITVEYMSSDGETVIATDYVNQFQGAYVLANTESAEGVKFNGWTFNKQSNRVNVAPNQLMTYGQVKDYAVKGKLRLYQVFTYSTDLVIGWDMRYEYSGLTANIIFGFEITVKQAVQQQFGDINVIVRGYGDADRLVMAQQIIDDGDVDVMVGVGNNIDTDMGVPIIEKKGGLRMGGIEGGRYIARLTESDVSVWLYSWLQTSLAQDSLSPGFIPPEDVSTAGKIVVFWESRYEFSGITENEAKNFQYQLRKYLMMKGYENVEVEMRTYDLDDTVEIGRQVNTDGDIDIAVGTGTNFTKTGDGYGNVQYVNQKTGFTIGGVASRCIVQISSRRVSQDAYELLVGDDATARNWLATDYVEPEADTDLIIGWSAINSGSSGPIDALNEHIMVKFEAVLDAWLKANGYEDVQVEFVSLGLKDDGSSMSITELSSQITKWESDHSKTFDMLLGVGKNINGQNGSNTHGNITGYETNGPMKMGNDETRYCLRRTDTDLVFNTYHWIISQEGLASFAPVGKHVIGLATGGAQLDAETTASVTDAIESYVKEMPERPWVEVRKYSGTADEIALHVLADGDVDILFALEDNVTFEKDTVVKESTVYYRERNLCVLQFVDSELNDELFDLLTSPSITNLLPKDALPVDNDLIIGWSAQSASTLTQQHIDNFEIALKAWLNDNGFEYVTDIQFVKLGLINADGESTADNSMDAPTLGEQIRGIGNIDILIGVGKNIDGQDGNASNAGMEGGVKSGPFHMAKNNARYTYRITDTEMVCEVYSWIISDEGLAGLQTKDDDLVIGWSALKSATVDALNDDIMAVFKSALEGWLSANGYENVNVTWVKLGENASSVKEDILPELNDWQQQHGPIDILLGFGSNVNSSGGLNLSGGTRSEVQTQGKSSNRYNYLMTTESTKMVYDAWNWINSAEGNSYLQTVSTSLSINLIALLVSCPAAKEVY